MVCSAVRRCGGICHASRCHRACDCARRIGVDHAASDRRRHRRDNHRTALCSRATPVAVGNLRTAKNEITGAHTENLDLHIRGLERAVASLGREIGVMRGKPAVRRTRNLGRHSQPWTVYSGDLPGAPAEAAARTLWLASIGRAAKRTFPVPPGAIRPRGSSTPPAT